jgi:hypothetical protein
MRFLFTTIQSFESEFYGRVGAELGRRGHDVSHITVSRQSSALLRRSGFESWCLPDLLAELEPGDSAAEIARIERQYGLPTIRDVYRTDPPCEHRSEEWCVQRTVLYFRGLEQLFDQIRPDVLVPEVGNELIRSVSHLVALNRGIPTLFLFYTIFPRPLRLYVDSMEGPIVPPEELRPLEPGEREEVERFIDDFIARASPIRAPRPVGATIPRFRRAAEYVSARVGADKDNLYLRPGSWALDHVLGWGRYAGAHAFYRRRRDGRPFVYFPLHVTEDYKIKRIIPHLSDQASIVEQVADSLPPGYDLVIKEHPLSIGRNPLGLLHRLRRRRNVVLLHPHTSSHALIGQAEAVVVISSTVGLEALLYAKPVLTIGSPFYAGYGITLDIDRLSQLREYVPALLSFSPDRARILSFLHAAMERCLPGTPVLVDASDENAVQLAGSLDSAAAELFAGAEGREEPAAALGV